MDPTAGTAEGPYTGRRVGGYRFQQLIGRGGMGEVYLGRDERLNRPVAIKALSGRLVSEPVARDRFVRETRLASKIVHPYVATVFDVVEHGDELLLVMEYIDGRRLSAVLRQERPELDEIGRLAVEMAEGLRAIHKAGLVHRDLKPGNVMITADGHVKLLDLGVARPMTAEARGSDEEFDDATAAATLTEEGLGVGTVAYMSPEQVRGRKDIDGRSDLFSLGTVLYEAITGDHPFRRGSLLDTASAILNDPPGGGVEPETLTQSGPLRDVVLRCLEKDRERRYASAEVLIRDLQAVRAGQPVLRPPEPSPTMRRVPPAWAWIAGALAVLATLFAFKDSIIPRPDAARPAPGGSVPGLLVLPFTGAERSDADALTGSMLASALRVDLALLGIVRVVPAARIDELSGGTDAAPSGKVPRALLDATSARFLVSASYERVENEILVALEMFDRNAPDTVLAFRAGAPTTWALTAELSARLGERLGELLDRQVDESVPSLVSSSDEALLAAERARRAEGRGRLKDAGRDYAEAIERDPRFLRAYLERAKTLYRAGYVDQARDEIDRALAEAEAFPRPLPEMLLLELRAVRSRVREDRAAEIDAYRKLAELRPEPEIWSELSRALNSANRRDEALAAIDSAIAGEPRNPGHVLSKARVLRHMGRFDEARELLARTEKLASPLPGRPFESSVAMERGYLHALGGEFSEARTAYERAEGRYAAEGNPLGIAEARLSIAQTRLLEGNLPAARTLLEEAADQFLSAGNLRRRGYCLESLGALLYQQGALGDAEHVMRDAVATMRETGGERFDIAPLLNLAGLLVFEGRWREATPLADEALGIARQQDDSAARRKALHKRAAILAQRGDLAAAAAAYRELLQGTGETAGDSSTGWAWIELGEILAQRGELREALEAVERGLEIQRGTRRRVSIAYAVQWRARILRHAGNDAAFIEALDESRAAVADDTELRDFAAREALVRGLYALERGELAAAAEHLVEVVRWKEDVAELTTRALGALARVHAGRGEVQEALASAQEALDRARTETDKVVAANDMAEVLAAAGRHADARRQAVRALDRAESLGMRFEIVRAAATALGLPEAERPADAEVLRGRGRRALDEMLTLAPGGVHGNLARRPAVQAARSVLGP